MKKLLIPLLALLLLPALAENYYDRNGAYQGRQENGRFYDKNGAYRGRKQ